MNSLEKLGFKLIQKKENGEFYTKSMIKDKEESLVGISLELNNGFVFNQVMFSMELLDSDLIEINNAIKEYWKEKEV